MLNPIWIATMLGLAGGVALSYVGGRLLLQRLVGGSTDVLPIARLALAGGVVALVPALLLSFVVGGTLGGAWGQYLFEHFGLPMSGVPAGLALGIALVFAGVLLGGAAGGALIGRWLARYRRAQQRV